MKQTVMKSSIQVWLGKRLVGPQHHSKKGESKGFFVSNQSFLLAALKLLFKPTCNKALWERDSKTPLS
jgi:hypothetical protein